MAKTSIEPACGAAAVAAAAAEASPSGKVANGNGHAPSKEAAAKNGSSTCCGAAANSDTNKMNGGVTSTSKTKTLPSRGPSIRPTGAILLRLLRIVVLDAPLTVLFALLVATMCVRHVYDNYLSVQLSNMLWTNGRKKREITYYDRRCEVSDISTRNVADLLIQSNYTTEDCVHHMMVHGASMYPDLISAQTATDLRNFVLKRNSELTDRDAISVIENESRWSFGIGANEHPSVARALREIATNRQLAAALEEIAGNDPAVIEMTAITSGYGGE